MINIGHLITADIIKSHVKYICKDSKIKSNFKNIELRIDSEKFEKFMPDEHKRSNFKKELSEMAKEILKDIESLEQIEIIGLTEFFKQEGASENIFIANPKGLDSRLKSFKEKYHVVMGILEMNSDEIKLFKIDGKYKNFLDCFGYADFSSGKLKYDNYVSFISSLGQKNGQFYKELKSKRNKTNVNFQYTSKELTKVLDEMERRFEDYSYYRDIKEQNANIMLAIRCRVKLDCGIGKFVDAVKVIIDENKEQCKALNNSIDLSIDNYSKIVNKNQKWSAYMYLFKLGIKTCPYCNRQYITPIYSKSNGKVRADLDHFYSKSKFPFFSMSLYNLIPSCKSCNSSLKGIVEFDYESNLNPYEMGFENLLKFDYKFNGIDFLKPDGKIDVDLKNIYSGNKDLIRKAENNVKCFKLDSLYSFYHGDEVKELILKRYMYTDEMINELKLQLKLLLGRTGTKEEYLKLVFGNYLNEEDFHKKPLSKLYKDIIDGLLNAKSDEKLKIEKEEKKKLEEFSRS